MPGTERAGVSEPDAADGTGLAACIAALLRGARPAAERVTVSTPAPLFGGNARRAVSFDLETVEHGHARRMACVMLSQVGGRQVESDVAREFALLHGLGGKGVRAPAALALDAGGAVVGAPSIVLERLPGKAGAVEFLAATDAGQARRLTADLARAAAELHAVDPCTAGLEPALAGLPPRAVAARQLAHWHDTFLANRMEPHPPMAALFAWLREHLPEPRRLCLVHGDLRPGNFLYQGDTVTGLLDWEMAHVGDPAEDVAWIFRPLWSPQRFVPLPEFVALYAGFSGCAIPWRSVLYYRVFSELKFATISLTAARAFASGGTRNLRHADRAATVAPCLQRAFEWAGQFEREPQP